MSGEFIHELTCYIWYTQVGSLDQYGDPNSFKPYWTGIPRATREEAVADLEAHKDVLGYNEQMLYLWSSF